MQKRGLAGGGAAENVELGGAIHDKTGDTTALQASRDGKDVRVCNNVQSFAQAALLVLQPVCVGDGLVVYRDPLPLRPPM